VISSGRQVAGSASCGPEGVSALAVGSGDLPSDGSPFTQLAVEAALRFACKRSGLRSIGSHVLRHTFASHLAMRGAAPKAIQELVGHATLSMTLRYMHLAPSALYEALGLSDFGQPMGNAEAATG
jgi:integrase